jgi:hypothetical protein
MIRYRPIVSVRLFGSLGSRLYDGCLDCASDNTIFPLSLARKLGIDLSAAPQGLAHPIGGITIPYSYAAVKLQLSDGLETCEWQATVGFVDLPLRWALLGHAGFLDSFDTHLQGARREVVITANALFPGTRTFHQGTPP